MGGRFEAYGWKYILVKDGNDLEVISKAIEEAKMDTEKPTLIEVKTVIRYGAPKAGTSSVHGAPIGADCVKCAKEAYGWEYLEFTVPDEVAFHFKKMICERGAQAEELWNQQFADYEAVYPKLASQFEQVFTDGLPENWDAELPSYEVESSQASRVSSKEII